MSPLIDFFLRLLVPHAHALEIGQESMTMLCNVLPCGPMGGGAAGLNAYVASTVVVALEIAIAAVAVVALLISTFKMVMFAHEEGAVKDARMSFVYVIVGLVITALTQWIVNAFAPDQVGSALVDRPLVESAVGNVITYIRLAISIALMINIVVQGFRVLVSQGEQDQLEKARKRLIGGFVGAAAIMLANAVVVAIVPELGGGATSAALQIAGVANYIVTILGFLAVLGVIIAGVLLMLSADEGLKDKAKTIIKTCIVAIIVVIVSYALVTAFILFNP